MNAKEIIKFVVTPEHEPARSCSCCGDIAHWPDMRQAKIFPFTDETEDVCFVACSEQCEIAFLTHPTLDNFVMRAIQEFQIHKKLTTKIDFAIWFMKLTSVTLNN
jgi:hypothetical protein